MQSSGFGDIFSALSFDASPSSRGLGHRVFIPATRVRLPLEMPFYFLNARSVVPNPCKKQATASENFVFPAVAFSFCLLFIFCASAKMGLLTYVWVAVASLRLTSGLRPRVDSRWRCHFFFKRKWRDQSHTKSNSGLWQMKFAPSGVLLFAFDYFLLKLS